MLGCLRFGLGYPKGPEKIQNFVLFTIERDAFHVEGLVNVHARQTYQFFPRERLPDLHFFFNPLKQTYSLKQSAHKLHYVSSYVAFTDIRAAAGSLFHLYTCLNEATGFQPCTWLHINCEIKSACSLFPSGCGAAIYSVWFVGLLATLSERLNIRITKAKSCRLAVFVEGTSQPPPPPFLRVSLCVHLLLCAALKVWITLEFHVLLLVPPFPILRVYKRRPVLLISLHCAAFFLVCFSRTYCSLPEGGDTRHLAAQEIQKRWSRHGMIGNRKVLQSHSYALADQLEGSKKAQT